VNLDFQNGEVRPTRLRNGAGRVNQMIECLSSKPSTTEREREREREIQGIGEHLMVWTKIGTNIGGKKKSQGIQSIFRSAQAIQSITHGT
jgi:hypothetical protein